VGGVHPLASPPRAFPMGGGVPPFLFPHSDPKGWRIFDLGINGMCVRLYVFSCSVRKIPVLVQKSGTKAGMRKGSNQ
jgi:hypothetical protein